MIRAMTDADIGPIAVWMGALPLWQRYNQTVVSLRTALAAAPVDDLLLVFAQPHPVGLAWWREAFAGTWLSQRPRRLLVVPNLQTAC